MSDIVRVSPADVREKVQSGKALLVCAYDDNEKYGSMRLEGSIALSELKSRRSGLTRDQEIIFF